MASLVNGLAFILKYSKNASFTPPSNNSSPSDQNSQSAQSQQFAQDTAQTTDEQEDNQPKLLVSIGSGVSMIKVDDFNKFERVGGTMIGGGTLLGLANLMTGVRDFD